MRNTSSGNGRTAAASTSIAEVGRWRRPDYTRSAGFLLCRALQRQTGFWTCVPCTSRMTLLVRHPGHVPGRLNLRGDCTNGLLHPFSDRLRHRVLVRACIGADRYPERPVRMIIPFLQAGPPTSSRAVAQDLSSYWGQVGRPGQPRWRGRNIANEIVARPRRTVTPCSRRPLRSRWPRAFTKSSRLIPSEISSPLPKSVSRRP